MKRFALLLITAILSLNCMAQSNDEIIVLNLQQVEFSDTSITKALSSVIQNPPKNSMIPKHLTLDFYQSTNISYSSPCFVPTKRTCTNLHIMPLSTIIFSLCLKFRPST